MSGDIFGCHSWVSEGVCHCDLVGTAWGSCSTSYKAQGSPPPQRVIPPQMSLVLRLSISGPERIEMCSSRWGQDRSLERDI